MKGLSGWLFFLLNKEVVQEQRVVDAGLLFRVTGGVVSLALGARRGGLLGRVALGLFASLFGFECGWSRSRGVVVDREILLALVAQSSVINYLQSAWSG